MGTATAVSPTEVVPTLFPLRKRTGTAAHHMAAKAVDIGIEDLPTTPKEATKFLAALRWGSFTTMPCPHCGTIDKHYWTVSILRWKCKCCLSRFSVTSGTVYADHKLPLPKLLKIIFAWANGAAGKPALQLRRDWHVAYQTAFVLCHKLREGLLRGFNTGILCGVHEMDGMDANGRRYKETRNKPLGGFSSKPEVREDMKKGKTDPATGELVGPPKPIKFDKVRKQHPDRRAVLVLRQRSLRHKSGAMATRVCVAISETSATVLKVARRFSSAESKIMTDEDPSYAKFKELYDSHQTLAHKKTYSAPGGVNNNQSESFNARMRRSIEGIYLCPSNKYLADYAAEIAWREDTRKLSTSKRLANVLKFALNVGFAGWWRGFFQGHHRTEELLVEGPRGAEARGKKKDAKAKPPR